MTLQEQPSPQGQEQQRTPLLSVADVASWLNVSQSYIYELANTGLIPCGKIGKVIRFEQSDIETWWKIRKRR
jgi:excisionase family DNA binding protein